MSYILAIDTSTDACSVALLTPSGIEQRLSISPREHTQQLLPIVDGLLAEHQLPLAQFTAIAFGAGPGSFTGLRIGLSVAQGLAYGADLPLVPISTLRIMAQTAQRLGLAQAGQTIVPVIDARMNEVYWSAFTLEASSQQLAQRQELAQQQEQQEVVAVCDERVSPPEQVLESQVLKADSSQQAIVAVGSGWHYDCLQSRYPDAQVDFYPQAHDLAILAKTAYEAKLSVSPLEATPTYLRDEITWQKRQRIRG